MRHLFATTIEELALAEESLRAALEHCAWVLSDEDTAGNDWCEREGYPGYTSYASLDDLPQRFPEFAELKTCLDKAAAELAEVAILEGYLPRQLSEAEVETIVREVIAEVGATSPRELGKVMAAAMARMQGVTDGRMVNGVARRLLSG